MGVRPRPVKLSFDPEMDGRKERRMGRSRELGERLTEARAEIAAGRMRPLNEVLNHG